MDQWKLIKLNINMCTWAWQWSPAWVSHWSFHHSWPWLPQLEKWCRPQYCAFPPTTPSFDTCNQFIAILDVHSFFWAMDFMFLGIVLKNQAKIKKNVCKSDKSWEPEKILKNLKIGFCFPSKGWLIKNVWKSDKSWEPEKILKIWKFENFWKFEIF